MTQLKEDDRLAALLRQAESILDTQPEIIDTFKREDVRKVLLELQVHRIELGLLNAELLETQRALDSADSRHMGLFNRAPIGYVILDKAGVIKQANTTFNRMIKLDAFKMLGMQFRDLLMEADTSNFLSWFKFQMEQADGEPIDLRFGKKAALSFYGRLEKVPGGGTAEISWASAAELLIAVRDVTREIIALTDLARERDNARAYFNNNVTIQIVLNRGGTVAQINPAGCMLLEAERESILGKNWFDCYVPSKDRRVVKVVFGSLLSGEIEPVEFFEYPVLTAKGRERLISWHNTSLRDPDGKISGTLSSGEDVTVKREAEASLRSVERLIEKRTNDFADANFRHSELIRLNRCRLIQDSIGLKDLQEITREFTSLLGTSAAVFERNGDYAYRQVAAGWCQLLDSASRSLCKTENTATALSCGRWFCHEVSFKNAERAMLSQKPEEDECQCGMRNYAVPILTERQCIGAVTFCYGDPPLNGNHLKMISSQYKTDLTKLRAAAEDYEHRPSVIIDIAKSRIEQKTRLIAVTVQGKCWQASLYRERESLKVVANFIEEGVITTDIQKRIVLINRVAEELTGWSRQKAQGEKISSVLKTMNIKSRKPCRDIYESVLKKGLRSEFGNDSVLISRSGDEHFVAGSVIPMVQKEGKISGMVIILKDITEKNALQRELSRQSQKMDDINKYSGVLAHELNNVLSIIIGNTELSLDEVEEWHPIQQYLYEIKTAGWRAKEVIKRLLNFRREVGACRDHANMENTVDNSLKRLRRILPTNVKIERKIPFDLDTIKADTTQLHRLLIILCNNAAHTMAPTGGIITITLMNVMWEASSQSIPHGLNPGRHVKMSICDTGNGIPEEIMDRILAQNVTDKSAGDEAEVRWAMVHGIVKAHKGAILAESEPGKGTVFDIYFPSYRKHQKNSSKPNAVGGL